MSLQSDAAKAHIEKLLNEAYIAPEYHDSLDEVAMDEIKREKGKKDIKCLGCGKQYNRRPGYVSVLCRYCGSPNLRLLRETPEHSV